MSTGLTVGLVVGALAARVPYVALGPGPTFDTLGESGGRPVIAIEGRTVYPTPGRLDLTTVRPLTDLTLGEALRYWFDRDEAVVPRDLVYPPDQTDEQAEAEEVRQMTVSQDTATTAALTELGIPLAVEVAAVGPGTPAQGRLQAGDVLTTVDGQAVTGPTELRRLIGERRVGEPVRLGYRRGGQTGEAVLPTAGTSEEPPRPYVGVETRVVPPFSVTIALKDARGEDIGGPSAGLMFALGIVDKLGPESLTGGRYVAGTGAITADGQVRPIGGIQQKLAAARSKGAEVFLVPAGNCAEAVAAAPPGLRLVRVQTLSEALRGLAEVRSGGNPPGCA